MTEIDVTPADVTPVLVTPVAAGDEIPWTEVPDDAQVGFDRDQPVMAVAIVADARHEIYEQDGKCWVSGIFTTTPACADTVEAAQALVADHYTDHRPAWDEYMRLNPPPTGP